MIRSIQVFRIQLLELEKVSDLCKDFCQRYTCKNCTFCLVLNWPLNFTACLRTKMRSDVLLRGSEGKKSFEENGELNSGFMSSSSLSSPSSASSSCPSPLIGHTSPPPTSPSLSASSIRSSTNQDLELSAKSPSPSFPNFGPIISPYYRLAIPSVNQISPENSPQPEDEEEVMAQDLSLKKSPKSPAVATSGEKKKGKECAKGSVIKSKSLVPVERIHHSKRGVLPKQATSIMRSWLFQHIVVCWLFSELFLNSLS